MLLCQCLVTLDKCSVSTVYKDGQPKCLDCPLVAGGSTGYKYCLLHVSRLAVILGSSLMTSVYLSGKVWF